MAIIITMLIIIINNNNNNYISVDMSLRYDEREVF